MIRLEIACPALALAEVGNPGQQSDTFTEWEAGLEGEDRTAVDQMRNRDEQDRFFQYLAVQKARECKEQRGSEPDLDEVSQQALVAYRTAMLFPLLRLVLPGAMAGDTVGNVDATSSSALRELAERGWNDVKKLYN